MMILQNSSAAAAYHDGIAAMGIPETARHTDHHVSLLSYRQNDSSKKGSDLRDRMLADNQRCEEEGIEVAANSPGQVTPSNHPH